MTPVSVQDALIEGVGYSDLCTLKRHAEAVVDLLPGPQVPFTYFAGVDSAVQVERPEPLHRRLRRAGHIEVCDTIDRAGEHTRQVYVVPEPVHEQAARFLATGYTPCPCGHRGLNNRADGTGYQCGWDGCDRVFTREEVEG